MNSIFDNQVWSGNRRYVTPEGDFSHQGLDPDALDLGSVCLMTFSAGLYRRVVEWLPGSVADVEWPYTTTPLQVFTTGNGKRFAVHFPAYGGTRVANSLEQLASCGVRYFFGLGLGGTPQADVQIEDIVLLEGAVRGDGVSRYYAPIEFPAVADFDLTAKLRAKLDARGRAYHVGLSFGIDALYREEERLIALLQELGVLSVDLESSAFLTVGRRLGLHCAWAGVISDRLVGAEQEGNIHPDHVMDTLLRLGDDMVAVITEDL